MTLVVEDTFTESLDIAVTIHTGETGASWTNHPASSGSTPVDDGGVDELHTANSTSNQYIYASGSPANADWKATVTFRNRSSASNGAVTAVFLRMNTSGSLSGYSLFYFNAATPYFRLYKWVSGTSTQLGSDYNYTLPAAEEDVDFYVVGSEIRAYNAAGTLMISATDTDVTSAGKLGIRFSDLATPNATGGVNISRIRGWDSATLPTPTAKSGSDSAAATDASSLTGTATASGSDSGAESDASAITRIITPATATPGASLPSAFGTLRTVQTADIQNAPCGFAECLSGKLIYLYNPSASHAGSGSIAIRSATSETAANAGTFSSATNIATEDASYYYGACGLTVIREGANAGRVWASYVRAAVSGSPQALNVQFKYSDDEGATWSAGINVSGIGDTGTGAAYGLKGHGSASEIIEVPGTSGQTLLLPIWSYDGSNTKGYARLIRSTDGGATWSVFATIVAYNSSYDTSEHHIAVVRLANGAYRLLCSIVYIGATNDIRTAYSDDWGASWSGMTVALSNATASPSILQLADGSIVMLYRNLADSEHTWMARSTDYGAAFSQTQVVDSSNRERYGQWQTLQSGRLGLCYGTESDSTHAGIYWKTYTLAAYTAGTGSDTGTATDSASVTIGVGSIPKTASDAATTTDTAAVGKTVFKTAGDTGAATDSSGGPPTTPQTRVATPTNLGSPQFTASTLASSQFGDSTLVAAADHPVSTTP